MHRRLRSTGWVVASASLLGLVAFLYPFLLSIGGDPTAAPSSASSAAVVEPPARQAEAPILFAVLTGACLLAILVRLSAGGGQSPSASKTVALLGVLVAIDATLRLVPSLLGASPIFLLIILVGSVFGPSFGFLMGALTLSVSAFLTGGLGPWLPYQMLGAGWVGLTAGWLPASGSPRRRLAGLAGFGAAWGFLYGALLNLYAWPFAAPGLDADVGLYWLPGLGPAETIDRYTTFYLVTSLGHDLFRAIANAALVLLLGGPLLLVLERFRARFEWAPWTVAP